MPNAAATTVPTTSAMRNENDLSRPLPSNDRTSTIAVVRIDTVRMCGSANVLSPGAPPRNSLSVNPDSETPTIKMTTPEIIGENRNRIRSITPVRHSNRNTSEAMRMDELAAPSLPAFSAPSMPAVPAAIINASNAADGPCTTGRRTSRVA